MVWNLPCVKYRHWPQKNLQKFEQTAERLDRNQCIKSGRNPVGSICSTLKPFSFLGHASKTNGCFNNPFLCAVGPSPALATRWLSLEAKRCWNLTTIGSQISSQQRSKSQTRGVGSQPFQSTGSAGILQGPGHKAQPLLSCFKAQTK